MESHKVFKNIEKGFVMFGRSMKDWIIILGVTVALWFVIYNNLPVHDMVKGLLGIATAWVMMQAVTAYRDTYPPKMGIYALMWMRQADNYAVTPDYKATPLVANDELIALEEDRIAQNRELTQLAREDRAQRRRNAGALPNALPDGMPVRRVGRVPTRPEQE